LHRSGFNRFRDAIDGFAKSCNPTARSDWKCSSSTTELRERDRARHRDADESDPKRTISRASIELGGALKNVFAVAAGISDGLGLGDNSKAALVTRSLAELVRLGVAMGGTAQAFYGLSGAGDLIVTCYSERSRNHTVGKRLGRGESLIQITKSMNMVAEGIPTARSAFECARQLKIETPIIDQVYAVLYEHKKPTGALEEVLSREQKAEHL
jgi:glycerol-3-phosphate dehydrogenase (NAD(P)+)